MTSFADLGVSPAVLEVLDASGIDEPFPIQALTLRDALAGRDVCGQAATGSGKTLAFSIPLVQRIEPGGGRAPRGLVLVPTRELCLQVVEVLRPLAKARGLRAAAIYGGASLERQAAAARK
ncbi:MAG: DEAD/DEAH box helicase, partial [Acidimicrobiales bacterium]